MSGEKVYVFDRSGHILDGPFRFRASADDRAEMIRARGHFAEVSTITEWNARRSLPIGTTGTKPRVRIISGVSVSVDDRSPEELAATVRAGILGVDVHTDDVYVTQDGDEALAALAALSARATRAGHDAANDEMAQEWVNLVAVAMDSRLSNELIGIRVRNRIVALSASSVPGEVG